MGETGAPCTIRAVTDILLATDSDALADEHLAGLWPIDRPAGTSGWQPSRYNDDRPGAGVLSTNSLWWR